MADIGSHTYGYDLWDDARSRMSVLAGATESGPLLLPTRTKIGQTELLCDKIPREDQVVLCLADGGEIVDAATHELRLRFCGRTGTPLVC